MQKEIVQRGAPRLWETPHTLELRRTEAAPCGGTIAESGGTVVVGEGIGGEQLLEFARNGVDVFFWDQSVNEGPAFGLPLVRRCEQFASHGSKGRPRSDGRGGLVLSVGHTEATVTHRRLCGGEWPPLIASASELGDPFEVMFTSMTEFAEIADRVWMARYAWMDVNVTAIDSERGVVVVDTHGSTAAGRDVLADIDRLGIGKVVHVINSHWHWDHTFGNAAFRERDEKVPIHAHVEAARWLDQQAGRIKQRFAESLDDPHRADVAATEIVVPDQTFVDTQTIDLGDRALELLFLGRGHTSGDIVLRVDDADVLVAGDLVEESAKPWIGLDSWPLEWSSTLDALLGFVAADTTVIPGHGRPVSRRFVEAQRDELAEIAQVVRQLAELGVPVERAEFEGEWPWDLDDRIHNAVTRGYEALSDSSMS